jgi:Ribosomal protein S10p/S20e
MRYILVVESFSKNTLKSFYNKLNYILNNKIFLKNFKNEKDFFELKIIFLPLKIKKYTLNKAHHIDKKAREQFETKIYKVFFVITPLIPITKKTFFIVFFFLKKLIKISTFTSLIKFKLNFII